MTYSNMIEWAFENGIDDFDSFLDEFGENFEFLREDFEESMQMPTSDGLRLEEVPAQSEPQEEEASQPFQITDQIRNVATSFINFFRSN